MADDGGADPWPASPATDDGAPATPPPSPPPTPVATPPKSLEHVRRKLAMRRRESGREPVDRERLGLVADYQSAEIDGADAVDERPSLVALCTCHVGDRFAEMASLACVSPTAAPGVPDRLAALARCMSPVAGDYGDAVARERGARDRPAPFADFAYAEEVESGEDDAPALARPRRPPPPPPPPPPSPRPSDERRSDAAPVRRASETDARGALSDDDDRAASSAWSPRRSFGGGVTSRRRSLSARKPGGGSFGDAPTRRFFPVSRKPRAFPGFFDFGGPYLGQFGA